MSTGLHRDLDFSEIHTAVSWVYADETARLAATGFTVADLYKMAWQTDTQTIFVLADYSPVTWVELAGGSSQMLNKVELSVRNETGSLLSKGDAVYAAGWSVGESRTLVALADKDDSDKRPAIGLIGADLANSSNGAVLISGVLTEIDTSSWGLSDQLVLGNSGALSRPPPDTDPFTGEVQNIGVVSRVDASDGRIVVSVDGLLAVTATQIFALAGSDGTPSKTNPYVTNSDSRNTNARTPTAHATTHKSGGSDSVKLDELAEPTDVTTLNSTTSRHGLLPKLGGGSANFLRADGTWAAPPGQDYQQVVTVAKSGGDYTSIQDAIDSISDASTSKRYVVAVYPGDYAENVTMKSWVDVVGTIAGACRITPTSGVAVTLSDSDESSLHRMSVVANYGALSANISAIEVSNGTHTFVDCYLHTSSTGGNYLCSLLNHSGGAVYIIDSNLSYSRAGGSGLNQQVIKSSFPDFYMIGTIGMFSQTTGTDTLYGIVFSGSAANVFCTTNNITVYSASGSAYVVSLTAGDIAFSNNNFTSVSLAANAYIGFISGSSLSAYTVGNTMGATAPSGNAYTCSVGSTCTWNSSFDVISAANGVTGAGTFKVVSSPAPGTVRISDNLTDGTNSLTVANAKTAYDHTSLTNNPHSVTAAQTGAAAVTNTAPVNVTKAAAAVGTSGEAARQDHKHDVTTAIASAQVPGDSAAEGSATSLARSDHKHGLPSYGTGSGTICQGNDSRLSDARTPTAHATTHKSGGSDSIKLDELAAATDNTNLNATTGAHGLLPKLGGGSTNFLRADGTWAAPAGSFNDFEEDSDEGAAFTTTSGTYVEASSFTLTLEAGTYLVMYSAELQNTDVRGYAELRIQIEDTTTIAELASKDASATHNSGAAGHVAASGFYVHVQASPGDVDFDFDLRRLGNGTASVRRRRIACLRVS